MNNTDREKYMELAHSKITAEEFYKRIRIDGLSKFDAFVLLREGFNLNLAECIEVSKQMSKVNRWLRWYDEATDELVGERLLNDITLAELQQLFHVPIDKPMYACWPVTAEQLSRLNRYVPGGIDIHRYAYFVEADSD